MSDSGENSPVGTYKTTVNINGGERQSSPEMFNLLPSKKEDEVEDQIPDHKHRDLHVPEGMMPRVETQDKALEALANIPIHQVLLNKYLYSVMSIGMDDSAKTVYYMSHNQSKSFGSVM